MAKFESALNNVINNDSNVMSDVDIANAIRFLISAELEATFQYEQLASKVTSDLVKSVLLSIAREEKVHAGELISLLSMYDNEFLDSLTDGSKEVKSINQQTENV